MIVVDASTLVSATFRDDSVPARAVWRILNHHRIAVSPPVLLEVDEVLHRRRLARFVDPVLRSRLLGRLVVVGTPFLPAWTVTDCRDAADNKYLELALASRAKLIVSSDNDLLVLHPWRGVRIIRPAEFLDAEPNDE